jgi:hypothetical protein
MAQKGLLKWVQFLLSSKSLNRLYLGIFHLHYRYQAAIHQFAIDANGTGTTFTLAAPFFRAAEMKIFAQHIEQALHRRNTNDLPFTIHEELNRRPRGAHRITGSSTG